MYEVSTVVPILQMRKLRLWEYHNSSSGSKEGLISHAVSLKERRCFVWFGFLVLFTCDDRDLTQTGIHTGTCWISTLGLNHTHRPA